MPDEKHAQQHDRGRQAGQTTGDAQGGFSLRVDLPRREEEILARWDAIALYRRVLTRNESAPAFILHDGPPFSSGSIHVGHLLNKLLKDFIVKYRAMQGFDTPFVPGWDTHALAVEIQAVRTFAVERHAIPRLALRQRCAALAREFCTRQRREFQRLGVRADWQFPYLTLYPSYEAAVIDAFAQMVAHGHVYRAARPVRWCTTCRTGLASSEVQAAETQRHLAHVAFPIAELPAELCPDVKREKLAAVIRTDRPWTLPGTVAVAAHPETAYALVRDLDDEEGFAYLVAEAGVEAFAAATQLARPAVVARADGTALAMTLLHPLTRKPIPLIVDAAAPSEATGLHPVAPDHDMDDCFFAERHGLPRPQLLDAAGRFARHAGAGAARKHVSAADDAILSVLDHRGVLLAYALVDGAVPCCWHCHRPVITRAVPQWYVGVGALAEQALAASAAVRWTPGWGGARLAEMVRSRPDWSISRQRGWGVPVPVLYCAACDTPLLDPELIARAAELVREEGADAWYARPVERLLPPGQTCPACGSRAFRQDTDVFDVWFESACSQFAVLEAHPALTRPADLVVEGHDQFRGWFQAALLAGLAAGRQDAPFHEAVAHGFVLDRLAPVPERDGERLLEPMDLVNRYGADVLRLWAATVDTRADVTLTEETLEGTLRLYRRLRSVAHFLLARLDGFTPGDALPPGALQAPERWALDRLAHCIAQVSAAQEHYAFHRALHALRAFCLRDLSGVYFSIAAARLRDEPAARPSVQTAMHHIAETLARLLAPTLSFLAEEVWAHLPAGERPLSPQLADWPAAPAAWRDDALAADWARALTLCRSIGRELRAALAEEKISAKQAKAILSFAGEAEPWLELVEKYFAPVLRVAAVELVPLDAATDDVRAHDAQPAIQIERLPIPRTASPSA